MWAAPEASSRSMIGGNQGRAAASSTIVTIQASSLASADSAPWAMARVRAADRAKHVAQDLHVQPLLAAVVVIEHRLVDAGLVGDAIDAGGVIAALGELVGGGLEDRRPGIAARDAASY